MLVFLLFITAANAQTFTNLAGEYAIIGTRPGDQLHPHLAVNTDGGWIVWQDNVTDGDGMGIGARHLDATFSGDLGVFRVNQHGAGEQQNPRVALLQDGGAAFVWQGGRVGFQKIFARFMQANGAFYSADFQVNTYTNQHQITPAIASLSNSNVVVAWASYGQDGSMLGIVARLLSISGQPLGSEFQVNEITNLQQRAPAVAGLGNGSFVVVWTCEIPRAPQPNDTRTLSVAIKGRIFNAAGVGGPEFLVSAATNICATPSVVATTDGGFFVTWGQNDTHIAANGWDIFGCGFTSTGAPKASAVRLNTEIYGDQFSPEVAASGTNCFVTWTSLGQDGSYEGVYGQFVNADGLLLDGELAVNTTTASKQMQPSVAADSTGRFLVAWSGYAGGGRAFDLYAQRFGSPADNSLFPPSAPYVAAISSDTFSVTWPAIDGYAVSFYELYVDDAATPIVVNGNYTTVTGLDAGSTHTFRLLYQLADGRRSPLSAVVTGQTWGADLNGDGLPDDWQTALWGADSNNWPSATADSDGDGASNYREFLAGTDPNDPNSVLRTRLVRAGQGIMFSWSTVAGAVYQVQSAASLNSWQNLGSPRLAHGNFDSINVGVGNQNGFYRVIRLQ